MRRMPLPPPPAEALTSAGRPTRSIAARNAVVGLIAGVSPGTTGTPARCMSRRASIFDPICAMTSEAGRRTIEARLLARRRERRVLREEPVAGMDRVGAGLAARRRCRRGIDR